MTCAANHATIRVISIEVQEQGKTISLKEVTVSYVLQCVLLHMLSVM
jgi:hypothetical protein